MMPQSVVALVTDLIFSTKITSTARSVGVEVHIVRSAKELAERLKTCEAGLAIIDLNGAGDEPLVAIRTMQGIEARPRIVAYLSHVQAELAKAAREAGADEVLTRSAFSERLPKILEAES